MGNCACCGQRENETAHSAELTATTIQSAKSLQDALTLDEAWQQAGSNVPDDDDESKDSKESKENNSKPICLMDKLVNQANVFDTEIERKKKIWKELDFFCLDNSIRETTVGQLASHTLTDKQNIFKELKKCGLTDIIVASFSSATKIDDTFVQWLQQVHGDDFDKFYSFSEVTIGVDYDEEGNSLHRYNSGDSVDDLPDGMKKNKFFGLRHTVFEMDFANNDDVTWGETWSVDDMCNLLDRRIRWVKDNICKEGRNFLNIRDFPFIMAEDVRRMLDIIKYLAEMPLEYRLFGIIYEDPVGECLPEQLAAWTRCIRDTMTACGWDDGKLLNHIHGKLGYKDAVTMDCLANGSDGMWAAVCEEGAAVGHCCTTVTMLNLIRHGNSKILEKYNCTHLRQAAINVTKITTKAPPHPKQIVYGERATDLVIGVLGIGFDIGKYFGIEYESRITTIATPEMIITRLKNIFGENEQFTIEMAIKMKEEIEHDLTMDIKSEYHSPYGIAMLFLRAGGKGSEGMMKILQKHNEHVEVYEKIKAEIRKEWNKYTINDIDVKQKVKHTRGTGSRAVLATMRRKMSRRKTMRSLRMRKGISIATPRIGVKTVGYTSSGSNMGFKSVSIATPTVTDTELKQNLLSAAEIIMSSHTTVEENENADAEAEVQAEVEAEIEVEAETPINENKEDEEENINSQDFLTFDRFYHGFMQPYFGCYRCSVTKNALKILDTGNTGTIEWDEFEGILDWVLNQHSSDLVDAISTGLVEDYREQAELLLKLTFEKAIIPLIRQHINADKNPFTGSNFIVVQPKNFVKHTATIIVLHGLANFDEIGGNGAFWYNQCSISRACTLYPHVRFVFPTADKLPIRDMNYSVKAAWFDVKHKSDPENGFKNLSGLYDSVEKVKTLLRQEMNTYNIPAERIVINGFSQGGTIALLAAFQMQEKFALVACGQTPLLGRNKKEWARSMHLETSCKKQKSMPIVWLDSKHCPIKCYKNLGERYGKECFDYLKQDCELNVKYQKLEHDPGVVRPGQKESFFQTQLAAQINRYVPPLQ